MVEYTQTHERKPQAGQPGPGWVCEIHVSSHFATCQAILPCGCPHTPRPPSPSTGGGLTAGRGTLFTHGGKILKTGKNWGVPAQSTRAHEPGTRTRNAQETPAADTRPGGTANPPQAVPWRVVVLELCPVRTPEALLPGACNPRPRHSAANTGPGLAAKTRHRFPRGGCRFCVLSRLCPDWTQSVYGPGP